MVCVDCWGPCPASPSALERFPNAFPEFDVPAATRVSRLRCRKRLRCSHCAASRFFKVNDGTPLLAPPEAEAAKRAADEEARRERHERKLAA